MSIGNTNDYTPVYQQAVAKMVLQGSPMNGVHVFLSDSHYLVKQCTIRHTYDVSVHYSLQTLPKLHNTFVLEGLAQVKF